MRLLLYADCSIPQAFVHQWPRRPRGPIVSRRTMCTNPCAELAPYSGHALPLLRPNVEADEVEHDYSVLPALVTFLRSPKQPRALWHEDLRATRARPAISSGSACPGFLDCPEQLLPLGQPSLSEFLLRTVLCLEQPAARILQHGRTPCPMPMCRQPGAVAARPTHRHQHARTAVLELRICFQRTNRPSAPLLAFLKASASAIVQPASKP